MLVSMECLIGSEYLKQVETAGLANDWCLSMGRRNSRYRDYRIALMSNFTQRWIDQNFAPDYTLKSLIKLLDREHRTVVNEARNVLRDYAYTLLGCMLSICDSEEEMYDPGNVDLSSRFTGSQFCLLLEAHFGDLNRDFLAHYSRLNAIAGPAKSTSENVYSKWMNASEWSLINQM
jgi:hypothetical protein